MLFKIGDRVRLKTIEEFEEIYGSTGLCEDSIYLKHFGKSGVITEDLTYMYGKPIYKIKFLEYTEALIVSRRWLVPKGQDSRSKENREVLAGKLFEGNEIMEDLENAEV
jgi:hypothetical protein